VRPVMHVYSSAKNGVQHLSHGTYVSHVRRSTPSGQYPMKLGRSGQLLGY
jgi:hypothetical protein